MILVRRRLFWKMYLTLLASLVAATILFGGFFWFLGEAQREAGSTAAWPAQATQYGADGRQVAARGAPISVVDHDEGPRHGPGHVLRLDLPDGGFVLTRIGPSPWKRALHLVTTLLAVAGGVGLAAYPMTALLTRRLEALRVGVDRWGEQRVPARLDERGSDEVARLAQAFNGAADRLDSLLASQKALLANASHELRSPLARLRLAIEVFDRDSTLSRTEIERNLVEMDELVEELLLSSRLEHAGPARGRRERVDLLGLAAEEGARYEALVCGEPVEIDGDPVLLRRLVRNLLENGARHGRPPISVLVERDETDAIIRVGDAGPGVAPPDRQRIFEPFFRPAGSSETSGGWGLGLSLVRQIAERHGGHAACVASAGGSQFVVRLDAARGTR